MSIMKRTANHATHLCTSDGNAVEPYTILEPSTVDDRIDVYLVHRGPDTKRDVVEPVAYLLKCLGVLCFSDTDSESYSMPLGDDSLLSMQKGLSFCRFALILLSEGFCDSKHCVKEVNTILSREQTEKRIIMIPALYTGSLNDERYGPAFGDRSALMRRSESSRQFAQKLVEQIMKSLGRPIPHSSILKYHLNEHASSSLEDIEDTEIVFPRSPGRQQSSLLSLSSSSMSTLTVAGSSILLQWKRPFTIPRHFLQGSVGRDEELAELHERLWTSKSQGSTSSVLGASVALRGPPGMGKTVVAALYTERYANPLNHKLTYYLCYPGGVIWLTVGPQRTNHEAAILIWQEMVQQTFPELLLRNDDGQDKKLYEADEVRNLLAYHPDRPGIFRTETPLLVILDDVWSEEVLVGIQEALPLDCRIIVTTRDADVAFALEDGNEGCLRLDVMSEEDAVRLLKSKVKDLPGDIAKRLARGMGCHAQALTLAAGTLLSRRRLGYGKTATTILDHLAKGKGFGNISRSTKAAGESRTVVEKALDISYDCLKTEDGAEILQQQFRALAVFAQEAEFSTDTAAFLWETDEDEALDFLLTLEALALVNVVSPTDNSDEEELRWQQHAVLRAYEQSRWNSDDKLGSWHFRHASYYTEVVKKCMEKRPRDFERIDIEFRQIRHAFEWSREECAKLVQMLVTSMSNYLIVRGRIDELESWLDSALENASKSGHITEKANILRIMGDIQLQMGNFDRSRSYLDQALQLFDDKIENSSKALTLHSIGDVEYRLGQLMSSRDFFREALSLFQIATDKWGIAVALRSLGDVERFLGNAVEARDFLSQAIALFASESNTIGEAGAVLALGRVESRVGNWDEAQSQYNRALSFYKKAKSQLGQGSTLKCMGDICLKKAELEEAVSLYNQALPLFTAMGDQLGEAQTLRCLGDTQIQQGSLQSAEGYLRKALPLYEVLRSERGQANCFRSLAHLELRMGEVLAAQGTYGKAKVLFESIRKQLWQNEWNHLNQVEYELQSLDPSSASAYDTWTLANAIQQPLGNAQTLDILSEVER